MKKSHIWTLRYDVRVRASLEKIRDKEVVRRIERSALRIQVQTEIGKLLKGYESEGIRSHRFGTPAGEYRIIYQLRYEDKIVFIILIGPRKDVYSILARKI